MVVKIERIWPAVDGCGFIDLTGGIQVWFSNRHAIKTQDEAIKVANKIINALNKK
jgi:hypothetical protein